MVSVNESKPTAAPKLPIHTQLQQKRFDEALLRKDLRLKMRC